MSLTVALSYLVLSIHSQWQIYSTIPMSNSHVSIGYYQNMIYVISGYDLMTYDLNNKTSTLNQTYFSTELIGYSQWWTHIGDRIYMLGLDSSVINVFDMSTKNFSCLFNEFDDTCVAAPITDRRLGCLASSNNHQSLYYVGGGINRLTVTNNLHILNLTNLSWSDGPSMKTPRSYFACIVSTNEKLYSIGGETLDSSDLSSIEFIATGEINSNVWGYTENNLSIPLPDSRAVAYGQYVYVIGGGDPVTNRIHKVDTISNIVYLETETLYINITVTAPIVIDGIIYAFGGKDSKYNDRDEIQYWVIPTVSPTACVDYDPEYNSVDGMNENRVIPSSKELLINNTEINIQNFTGQYTNKTIECNNSNSDICFIGCYESAHCHQTSVHLTQNDGLVLNDTKIVYIVCNQVQSCGEMLVNVDANMDIELVMECSSGNACQDVEIHLVSDNGNVIVANISCYHDNACNNLRITTDNSENVIINLNAFRYSSNIIINHYYDQNINVKCGSNDDRRYIRYDVNDIPNSFELLKLAQNEYPSSNRLPCEDINIICENTDITPQRGCEYQYQMSKEFSLIDIVNNGYNCYWLDIDQLYLPSCKGTCGDNVDHYKYTKTLELNLVFYESENTTNNHTTTSYNLCHEYFGEINSTNNSLDTIDVIFNWALNLVVDASPYIHQVIKSPLTSLADNETSIKCIKDAEENVVPIIVSFIIESPIDDQTQIDPLFDEDSTFINDVNEVLAALFGARIEFNVTNNIQTKMDIWIIIVIPSLALCIFGLIIIGVGCKNRLDTAKREAMTIYIRNPMVISIAIGFYDTEPSKKVVTEFGGYLKDLDGIENDIKTTVNLFKNKLNYEVFPEYDIDGGIKQKWTLKEIMKLLNKYAQRLENNISKYDGLIVLISCHGIRDHIVTSDYQKIHRTEIHRLFSLKRPKCRQIPRLFLFDCCSGKHERETDFRGQNLFDKEEGESSMSSNGKGMVPFNTTTTITDSNKSPELVKNSTITSNDGGWYHGEDNPDYKLATIHAANSGYISKMKSDTGSYLISSMAGKLETNIESGRNKKFISEILDEVQNELHKNGKQLTVHTFNNGTGYIKFVKNEGGKE